MSTKICLMGREDSDVIQGLHEALRNRVCRVECYVSRSDMKPNQDAFNTIVCLHDTQTREIDQESQMLKFGSILDVERQVSRVIKN